MLPTLAGYHMRSLHEPDVADPVRFLDDISDCLESGRDVSATMDILIDGLWWLRRYLQPEVWVRFCVCARAHRLASLVHQDPFTCRSFQKPRGYAGDAMLLDMIYHDLGVAELGEPSPLGRAIFDLTTNRPAPAAVRERRDFVAHLIDETCAEVSSAAILSVAGGHAREATRSAAVQEQTFGRFLVLDQDAESLALVQRCYGGMGVETTRSSIARLLASPHRSGSFDLIYSTGLYDYLPTTLAERLIAALFSLLRPGARLVIGNFVPWVHDVGYMECYMDWRLIFRDGGEMQALAASLPQSEVSTVRSYTLSNPDVMYLEVQRRRRPFVAGPGLEALSASADSWPPPARATC